MKKPNRRLAAIMFTDIVGYSAMMQKDETITSRLRNRHREVFVRLTKQYDGEIIQYFGDGTLSIYPSAAAAVECGVALQKELKRDPAVPIRIGIHTGDITYNEEDAFGDGVNVAARIESLSIPGGVFISEKVYDDIKNHSWLKAQSLGAFDLKNIQEPIRVYAVTNRGLTVPEPVQKVETYQKPNPQKMVGKRKRKSKAGWLALLFGIFGTHRFYLGQRNLGILYLSITLLAMFIIPSLEGLIGMMAIISFVDAMLIWSMNILDFDSKYNPTFTVEQTKVVVEKTEQKTFLQNQFDVHFQKAKQSYQDYRYHEATEYLGKALEIKYDEPDAQFLLACCYSILENPSKAFAHLDAAVAFGLKNVNRIEEHDNLAFLRIQPEYESFAENGFRILEELPPLPEDEIVSSTDEPDLLEQLNKLHKLYEGGFLTEAEYLKQEERLKSRDI